MDEWERKRAERSAAFDRDAAPLKAALAEAGVDPADFGYFVNRPVPGLLRPSSFDHAKAMPILVRWLPRIANETVKESMVRHLRIKAAGPEIVDRLLQEFKVSDSPYYKWVVADVLQYVCKKGHFPQLVELAADRRHGTGRAPLVDMLWRVKTPQADEILSEAVSDPDTARVAMSGLRRRRGNEAVRPLIEPLLNHPHEHVRLAAQDHLRRIDKYLGRANR